MQWNNLLCPERSVLAVQFSFDPGRCLSYLFLPQTGKNADSNNVGINFANSVAHVRVSRALPKHVPVSATLGCVTRNMK